MERRKQRFFLRKVKKQLVSCTAIAVILGTNYALPLTALAEETDVPTEAVAEELPTVADVEIPEAVPVPAESQPAEAVQEPVEKVPAETAKAPAKPAPTSGTMSAKTPRIPTKELTDKVAPRGGGDQVGTQADESPAEWFIFDSTTGEITGLTEAGKNQTTFVIPAAIGGVTVTGIGGDVFKGNTQVTTVTMPDTITFLGASAFQECTELTSVTLSNSLQAINNQTFWGCRALTSVDLGALPVNCLVSGRWPLILVPN